MLVDLPILSLHGYTTLVLHEAAHCGGDQNRYWEMHDAIFAAYESLSAIDPTDEKAAREAAIQIGASTGADADRMRECLETQKYRQIVLSIAQDAQSRGIDVTPTILIGSEPVQGAVPYADLKPIIDRELKKAIEGPSAAPATAASTMGP